MTRLREQLQEARDTIAESIRGEEEMRGIVERLREHVRLLREWGEAAQCLVTLAVDACSIREADAEPVEAAREAAIDGGALEEKTSGVKFKPECKRWQDGD